MKFTILALFGLLTIPAAFAQTEIPANPTVTPKKFTTRAVGGGVNPGVSIDTTKPENPNVRYVTHVVLYQNRFWTSAEGKPLEAKLIAFEDIVAEVPKGATEPVMPAPPENPTVVRDGKIRLLIDKKPVELALDRLSRQDQEFVGQIKASLAKKAEQK
ncbi:hypothetical protein JIN84_21050 [Luteolibacter yonseiensis]|uniref:Uncharacterized protein n=1 Tax=Luteolibacter yonseiensis TaxID=1144680 RepID=A0A934VE08_9BACT|nr:hypothetical protein [Luteolibacter yonseiensis]MBK1818124.1 hypothetical protein [Luteolibacter yonseiensis]